MSIQIETAQNVGVDYEIASIGDRILAQLLDYMVYFGWFMAMAALLAASKIAEQGVSGVWIWMGAVALPIMLYPLLTEYFLNGQTVGKIALKIRVIKLDGSKATLSSYLLRWLLSIVDIGIFSGLVAIITIAATGKGQRIGDLAAGTTVIKTKPTVRLENLIRPGWTSGYQPSFPNVVRLSDKDIATLRKVIASNNAQLQQDAVHKIEELIGVHSLDESRVFLKKVINDYEYFATLETN